MIFLLKHQNYFVLTENVVLGKIFCDRGLSLQSTVSFLLRIRLDKLTLCVSKLLVTKPYEPPCTIRAAQPMYFVPNR